MNRSQRIQQKLEGLRGGEPVELNFIRHEGDEVASQRLFLEGSQLKLREIAEISEGEIKFRTKNISWRTARNLINAHLQQPREGR